MRKENVVWRLSRPGTPFEASDKEVKQVVMLGELGRQIKEDVERRSRPSSPEVAPHYRDS